MTTEVLMTVNIVFYYTWNRLFVTTPATYPHNAHCSSILFKTAKLHIQITNTLIHRKDYVKSSPSWSIMDSHAGLPYYDLSPSMSDTYWSNKEMVWGGVHTSLLVCPHHTMCWYTV